MSEKQTGIQLIEAERRRQIEKENWTSEHDDEHKNGDLRDAAEAYLLQLRRRGHWSEKNMPEMWPWDRRFWKPSADPIRQLVKAGALIAAEIDRLQRNNPMTIDQLNKHTDEEVRVRVALALGLNVVDVPFVPAKVQQGSVFTKVAHEQMLKVYPMGRFQRIPNYPADLNAAFTLVEKLREEGWRFMLDNIADNWEAEFFRRTPRDSRVKIEASPARAICLAFLAVTKREEG